MVLIYIYILKKYNNNNNKIIIILQADSEDHILFLYNNQMSMD